MKKTFFLVLLYFSQSIAIKSQTLISYNTEKDVFTASSFVFCGFDYTQLRINDEARTGQVVKTMFPGLTKFLSKEASEQKMEIWLKMPKGSVQYSTSPADSLNAKINNGKIVVTQHNTFPKELLSETVKNYQIEKKDGIGYSIVFECFDRPAKTVSGYLVFFDIVSRKVLYISYTDNINRNQYTHLSDWKAAALEASRKMIEGYLITKKSNK